VSRLGPTVLVIALLAATIAAFALAERLKLEPSPITNTRVPNRIFSPVCDCPTEIAPIRFVLRKPGRVVAVILHGEDVVRTLADRRYPAGPVRLRWDGRDEAGRVVPEAAYMPRVRLPDEKRTFSLRTPIRVDTTPPRVLRAPVGPRVFSPDGDGRKDHITALYALNERAHGLLFVNGAQVERKRFQRLEGTLRWSGLRNGRTLPAGRYRIEVGAEDDAGNRAEPVDSIVRIRYVELGRDMVRVRTLRRFGVRVIADASSFRWRFAGGTGKAEPGVLVLRAPRRPGRYQLFVEANGHGARAVVVVSRRRPAS
jgi:hypothetical protein